MNGLKKTKSEVPILMDFTAEWCGPCQTMDPVIKRLKERLGDKVRVIKIDVDDNPLVAKRFHITNVPTFILLNKGEEYWRQVGLTTSRLLAEKINELQLQI